MNKSSFINEINRTIENINLKDSDLEYTYEESANPQPLSDNTVASVYRIYAEVKISYKGKTKTYKAGDNTTFPCEFITDYESGYYKQD